MTNYGKAWILTVCQIIDIALVVVGYYIENGVLMFMGFIGVLPIGTLHHHIKCPNCRRSIFFNGLFWSLFPHRYCTKCSFDQKRTDLPRKKKASDYRGFFGRRFGRDPDDLEKKDGE